MRVFFMATERIRIRLKAYDSNLIDQAPLRLLRQLREQVQRYRVLSRFLLGKEVVTILRAVHKYKDSREQFELRTHKRLIDVLNPNGKTIDALKHLDLPAGVDIELKI